jgi:hypothetical protein
VIKLKTLLIVAMFCFVIVFAGCGAKDTNTVKTNGVETPKQPANNVTKTDTAPAGDKIGVPECDEYIEKYEACLTKHVPEAQRGYLKGPFEQQREGFKKAAANPTSKAELPGVCKKVIETAKTSMAAYKCDW